MYDRLVFVDVEASRGNMTRVEGGHERRLVDDGTAGGVDDDNAGFGEGKLVVRDDVPCLRLQS